MQRVAVAVAVHRCTDRSADVARRVLAECADLGRRELDWAVWCDDTSTTVGEVRGRLVSRAAERWSWVSSDPTWLMTTDADSVVPPDWVSATLQHAARTGADAVTGLVELDGWRASTYARARYDELIAAGFEGDTHRHVYGANLAVSMRAYLDVGGFAAVRAGEDHDLIDRVAARRWRVSSARQPVVRTAARQPGRAADGLGALLSRLASEASPLDPPTTPSAVG